MAFKKVKKDIMGFSGKPWPQYQKEIQGFIQLLLDEGCKSYLEIGCRYGDTWHAVGMALPKHSKLVAVDLPGAKSGQKHKGGHQNSFIYLKRAKKDLQRHNRDAHVIIGDSQDKIIIGTVKWFAPFDAILIDGDHTANGVRQDLENYGPMAKFVAFHDIVGTGKWARQIRPIFLEYAEGKKSVEFVRDGLRRGIGVVWT